MLKLRAVFSYGLNVWLDDVLVRSKFPALPRKFTRISESYVHKLNTSLFSGAFLGKFNFYLLNKLSYYSNFSRIHLLVTKKIHLTLVKVSRLSPSFYISLELCQKLETWIVSTHPYVVLENIFFSTKTPLILLMSAFFWQKISIFFGKNSTSKQQYKGCV